MRNSVSLIGVLVMLHNCWSLRQSVKVTSVLEPPYLMLRADADYLTGNARYEGFSIDLAEILSTKLNFEYTLTPVPDKLYGTMSTDGMWNGMIGELHNSTADIAIAPLTTTAERAEVVDFSTPFIQFRLKMVMKKREEVAFGSTEPEGDNGPYLFLRPFTGVLWAVTVVAIVILVLLLYTIEHFVTRREDADPPGRSPPRVKLCGNGMCGTPRTVSGRLIQILFWIVVLFLTGSYIAGFTEDRIVDRLGEDVESGLPVKSIEQLAGQTEIKYGVIRNGSTFNYFKHSWERLLRKMFAVIQRESVSSQAEGYERVRNDSDYAYLVEAPSADYMETRLCDIESSSRGFGPVRGFAVATRISVQESDLKNLKDRINLALLEMRENDEIEMLRKKWFYTDSQCPLKQTENHNRKFLVEDPLSVFHMAGVFFLVLTSVIVALGIGGLEIWSSRPKEQRHAGVLEMRAPLHPATRPQNSV